MSKKARTLVTICLIIAIVALGLQIVMPIIGDGSFNWPAIVCTGILPVVLITHSLSSKKNDDDKK